MSIETIKSSRVVFALCKDEVGRYCLSGVARKIIFIGRFLLPCHKIGK